MSNHRRTVLICYDIADPRRLRRVFRELQDVAQAVQKSVFIAELTTDDLNLLWVRLAETIQPDEDRLQLFYLQDPAMSLALGETPTTRSAWVV
jgi:CRISPR-associated protein Cas2